MSDAVQLALIASMAPTIAALAAVVVSMRNAGKLTEIHTLTNSNLSKVNTALDVANEKIIGLQTMVATLTPVPGVTKM